MNNVKNQEVSCVLCAQGQGCSKLFALFGTRKASNVTQPLQPRVASWAYGLPLGLSLSAAVLGSYFGELASILGFGIGLLLSFFILKSKSFKSLL